jgi:predicted nucleotidyltransferase
LAFKIGVERLRARLMWRCYVALLAEAAREVLGGTEVYVFGSAVEGRLTADSDIDVAVVMQSPPVEGSRRAELTARILEAAERRGVPWWYPFEIHLLLPGGLELLEARFVRVDWGREVCTAPALKR